MSIVPTKESDEGRELIGGLMESAYQIDRASKGKPYKPMGQEEIVEPVGKWVGRVLGSKANRGRGA
jgi:hypothetical protein